MRVKFARPSRITFAILTLVLGGLVVELVRTAPVRDAVRTFKSLIDAGNRGDLGAAKRLCSSRYLRTHDLRTAEEGGIVGLPRSIHPNFAAWRHGSDVWICPTDRQLSRPVFQLVRERQGWRFDGPVGVMLSGREFQPMEESAVEDDAANATGPPR